MQHRKLFYFFILFCFSFLQSEIFVIPIDGDIVPATYIYLERATKEAQEKNASLVIYEINTFGGRLDVAYRIVELILSSPVSSVSLVKEKAISAGTLIAMASNSLYMFPGATMGDVAPIQVGTDGAVKMLGEKFQSPLRAKFRALAEKNGYPIKLSESFVSSEIEIVEITWSDGRKEIFTFKELSDFPPQQRQKMVKKKTLVAKGELLTMNDKEAFYLNFSKGTVNNVKEIVHRLEKNYQDQKIVRLEKKASEKLLFLLGQYAWILILIGFGAIYFEVKSAGFGLFGFVGILAFGFLFTGQYLVQLADYMEFFLVVLGFILVALEIFFFPGSIIFGLLGIVFILFSLVLMFQTFVIPANSFELILFQKNIKMVLIVFCVATMFFLLSFCFFPRFALRSSLVFRGVIPRRSQEEKKKDLKDENFDGFEGEAVAKTDLKLSGKILWRGDVYDALSNDVYIARGQSVKIVKKRGNVFLVQPIKDLKEKESQ